jgi:triosephosphate isomerase
MIVVVNFKNYVFGERVREYANAIDGVENNVVVAVPSAHIWEIADKTRLNVFAQGVDVAEKGRSTGKVLAESVKGAGAIGTLLNHSENRLSEKELGKTINACKKSGLKTLVCVKSLNEAKKIKRFKPWAVAYEDPKLIASNKSVSKYRSAEVREFSKLFDKSGILSFCGAGINSHSDVIEAKGLGCKGILVSSDIMKSSDPARALVELLYSDK